MKKLLSIAILLPLLFSCDKGNTEPDAISGASIPAEEKALIVFFSRAGENWLKKLGFKKKTEI